MGEPPGELEFYVLNGDLIRFAAEYGPDRPVPGQRSRVREVRLNGRWKLLQHRLPSVARNDRPARQALEREAGVAVAVERAYGERPYAELFTRCVGYQLDTAEPFVVYRLAVGEPLAQHTAELGLNELATIMRELVLTVHLLAHLGLAHRGLTPHSVRWDGKHIRVPEPRGALALGQPREPYGSSPWAPPEQLAGIGSTDSRDDLWSVARLSYYLVTGQPGEDVAPPADLESHRWLSAFRSAGLFSPQAADRATPADLLGRLNCRDPLADRLAPADPLAAARAEFDQLLAAKRLALGLAPSPGQRPPREPQEPEAPAPQWGSRGLTSWINRGRSGGAW